MDRTTEHRSHSELGKNLTPIEAAPKAELHVHLEGTLEPEMLFALAGRNGMALPWRDVEELRTTYRFDGGLESFIPVYRAGLQVLRTERDYYDLTKAYLAKARENNVVHAEVFTSPQAHMLRDVPVEAVLEGVEAALAEGRDEYGMTLGLIIGIQRHLDEADALAMLQHVHPYRDQILGLGMGGMERGNPPAKFTRAYARSRDFGWRRVAHAGEEGPAAYVREALDVLGIERIDHGVRCEEDPDLVRRLVDEQIALTVCPLSNVMLRVFPDLASHNLARLLRAGVCVTINSDDPPYFGGYINDNYTATAAALGLTEAEQFTVLRNGFRGAFLPEEQRAKYLRMIDDLAPPTA